LIFSGRSRWATLSFALPKRMSTPESSFRSLVNRARAFSIIYKTNLLLMETQTNILQIVRTLRAGDQGQFMASVQVRHEGSSNPLYR
jgi:hypothetical protein